MARKRDLFLPWKTVSAIRDQLGSIRGVYLGRDGVVRHDDAHPSRPTVVLIHGFFQTRNLWAVMERRLREQGIAVYSFRLNSVYSHLHTNPIARSASIIAQKIEKKCVQKGLDHVHLIGHSKGGLVGRYYVQKLGGYRRVRNLITLGTPHHGTPTAYVAMAVTGFGAISSSAPELLPNSRFLQQLHERPLPSSVFMTSIYSRDDLVCPYRYSIIDEGPTTQNVEYQGLGHSQLAWDEEVFERILSQIREHS